MYRSAEGAPALCTGDADWEEPALTVELRPAECGADTRLFWLRGEVRWWVWVGERGCEAGTGEDSLTGECSGLAPGEMGENGVCSGRPGLCGPGEVGDRGLGGKSSVESLVRGILLTWT